LGQPKKKTEYKNTTKAAGGKIKEGISRGRVKKESKREIRVRTKLVHLTGKELKLPAVRKKKRIRGNIRHVIRRKTR